MNHKNIKKVFILLFLCIVSSVLISGLKHISYIQKCLKLDVSDDKFRCMNITCTYEELITTADVLGVDQGELMVVCGCMYNGEISCDNLNNINKAAFVKFKNYLKKTQTKEFNFLKNTYTGLFKDIKYFPVPRSNKRNDWVNYVNSWNNERTYKGNRTHEGTDIMGDINKDGIYPVISVSDGYISNIGWLELGGWRIGVTSPNGIYYYYAHLDSYAKEYKEGDYINAGDIIGYMGSTGYSKVEGTKNKFPAHLHFGIYVMPDSLSEISINPYYILKINENNTLIYSY